VLFRSVGIGYADPDGLETVADWSCVESCPVRKLGEQSGESKSSGGRIGNKDGGIAVPSGQWQKGDPGFGDVGTAARFFHQSDWSYEIAERLAEADPVKYCPKAARTEREAGLRCVLPCLQCGEIDSEIHIVDTETDEKIPAHLAGSDGLPTLDEMREMAERIRREKTGKARWAIRACRRNDHPTAKPLSLVKYLATLLLPPPEYAPRRILVPFAGTGSEGLGALLAGWDEIVMIDNNAEYCQIAEARCRWWARQARQMKLGLPRIGGE